MMMMFILDLQANTTGRALASSCFFSFFHVFLSYVCLRFTSSKDFESAVYIACISVLHVFCRICIYITFYKDTPVGH